MDTGFGGEIAPDGIPGLELGIAERIEVGEIPTKLGVLDLPIIFEGDMSPSVGLGDFDELSFGN